MIDITQTILSQYGNSPILLAMIDNMNDDIDPRSNLEDFYNQIWNIETAVGYGLDVWGRIVGVERALHIVTTEQDFFGFNEVVGWGGFAEADGDPFYGGVPATDSFILTDDDFRKLILIKALANISGCSIAEINQLLRNAMSVLGYGDRACVRVLGNMSISYNVDYPLTPVQVAMLGDSGAMLNPAGVTSTLTYIPS